MSNPAIDFDSVPESCPCPYVGVACLTCASQKKVKDRRDRRVPRRATLPPTEGLAMREELRRLQAKLGK